VENLPELVLTGATGYLADMGVTVVSCAVNPAAGAANKVFATLVVKLKGGQILTGTARFRSSKAGGLSRYLVEAFANCTQDPKQGDYRAAQNNPSGINSALNTVALTDDEHYRQGLHTHKNLDGVTKVLKSANRKGCEFVAGALRDLAKRNGKVDL
jgi:hypothetical protein